MRQHELTILRQQTDQSTTWMRRFLLLASIADQLGIGDEARRVLKMDKAEVTAELLEMMERGEVIKL